MSDGHPDTKIGPGTPGSDKKESVLSDLGRTLLSVPRKTSWCACTITASFTKVSDTFMHGLRVNLQISFLCRLIIALGALVSQSFMLIIFV